MPTPYGKIQDSFHSKFQSKTELPAGIENQFFYTAVGDFGLELYEISFTETTDANQITTINQVTEDLKQQEVNLLGMFMYRAYLSREKDRILKLNDILGKDIKLTGMASSKQTIIRSYQLVNDEISDVVNKLKTNSFSE